MRRGLRVLIPGLLLTLCACARHRTEGLEPVASPVRVEVHNNYALAMEIYAVGAGTRYELGVVHPGMTAQFEVPQTIVGTGSVEFQALPHGSSRMARTGPLLLSPGAVVDFEITQQLFNSTASIRP